MKGLDTVWFFLQRRPGLYRIMQGLNLRNKFHYSYSTDSDKLKICFIISYWPGLILSPCPPAHIHPSPRRLITHKRLPASFVRQFITQQLILIVVVVLVSVGPTHQNSARIAGRLSPGTRLRFRAQMNALCRHS